MTRSIKLIAAIDEKGGLSRKGSIPWDLPADRAYFRDHVRDKTVLMGWKTYIESGRISFGAKRVILLSDKQEDAAGVEVVTDLDGLLNSYDGELWVIGGGATFAACLPYADELYLTRVAGKYECDVVFPAFERAFRLADEAPHEEQNGIPFRFQRWRANRE